MKYSNVLPVVTLAGWAAAFPAAVREAVSANAEKYQTLAREKRLSGISPGFNASAQYISTSGAHAWVAPKSTDQRGPCPGLNAFANHGYIPHNGVATIAQFIDATTSVVGMGADLAAFLAIYGAVFDGDLTSWSIGGPDPSVGVPLLGTPLGLVGVPQGISGSHNKYEADASPSRPDLYEYGNDYKVILSQFTQFYAQQAALPVDQQNFDIGQQTAFRVKRFQQSVDNNPYFFNAPFSGVLVQPAAYTFQFRFMANHSAEYPEGQLNGDVLKTWFGITGDYPHFNWTAGQERIPNNWYRRAFGDEYTIPYFLQDVVGMAAPNPQFLDIGGNLNGTNTFAGVDLLNATGGLYNAADLLNPATLSCFLYQLVTQALPDLVEPAGLALTSTALGLLDKAAAELDSSRNLSCSQLPQMQSAQFHEALMRYPGYAAFNFQSGSY